MFKTFFNQKTHNPDLQQMESKRQSFHHRQSGAETNTKADPGQGEGNTKMKLSLGVLGAKGGSGASTLALNLGIALSRSNKSSTVVDANLQQPDLVIQLGQEPQHSMLEFLARSQDVDNAIFQACSLTVSDSNGRCSLMSPPASGEASSQSTLTRMAESMPAFFKHSDFLIFDLPKNLDRHLVNLLDKLDLILLVFEGTVSSVAAAKRWQKIFFELGYPAEKVLLVLNRAGSKTLAVEKDLEQLLKSESIHKVPNAFRLGQECCNSGKPALLKNPQDKYSVAVLELSGLIAGMKRRIGKK